MNYHQFQEFRRDLLSSYPSVVDLAESNIWRSLSHLIPDINFQGSNHIHRCHLAEAWLQAFDMPSHLSKYTMISTGVRHSLRLLLKELSFMSGEILMPTDVYPVYHEISRSCGLAVREFETFPEFRLPDEGRWLLLPNPIKPAGRWMTLDEVGYVEDWLKSDPERRVLIDGVYNFQSPIHESTRALLATQQVFFLHSLSKSFLHPKVMGVCIIPEQDWEMLSPTFRSNSPDQSNLQLANSLLREHLDISQAVDETTTHYRNRMLANLPVELKSIVASAQSRAGYFTLIAASQEELLTNHRILSMPLTVFGSRNIRFSVLSSLKTGQNYLD